ncbi:precorrin-3B C(17)-methyltransferase [Xaviernesmea oryzae]|uniref:Precorrin-3B C(17)-methyltransferase n=1 Tax=Xaviernesmea oryzae TaxID=464029 RepID=A0A1Q9AZ47_9HYPH|nr:precorrin-3B C(17)-methyltransferase [Xaviernesmea oryzae]OLP60954.1 precorrin-3B C(17)-methyltransferase [Xaviernesmea oryzae]SEL20189.1 precorrin-3B C17-methyltransferase [Xaviernesmea oryzae]
MSAQSSDARGAGRLTVIGTGPGAPGQMTPDAQAAVEASELFFGYGPYLDRLALKPHQQRISSDNREELARASHALEQACAGHRVCMVSGGDPGVFAMAAAVCEAIDRDPQAFGHVELEILPGVTAMLAVAARAGAPLGHDFCAISLSDNLKPWPLIVRRLQLAAEAGLVIALYNPISRARPWQLGEAFTTLRAVLPATVPVIFGRAAGRPDEAIRVLPLSEADPALADMATCVIIGSAETRIIARPGQADLVYTPRYATGAQGSDQEKSAP